MMKLVRAGASLEQIEALEEKTADRHAALRDLAIEMGVQSIPVTIPEVTEVTIPEKVSRATRNLILQNAQLQRNQAELHNSLKNASLEELTDALISWRQDSAAELEVRDELARQVQEESSARELPMPRAPRIPKGATPEFKAFLMQRMTLMKEQIALTNQTRSQSPEVSLQALSDWREENADRLQSIDEAAIRISDSIFSNPTTSTK